MRKPSTLLWTLSLIASLLLSCSPKPVDPAHYRIRFGLVEKNAEGIHVLAKETTVIPMIVGEENLVYGYEITPLDQKPYTAQFIMRLPYPPQIISGPMAESNPGKPTTIINSPLREFPGKTFVDAIWFDHGDPIGAYVIDVLVNGTLVKTIRFDVQKPE